MQTGTEQEQDKITQQYKNKITQIVHMYKYNCTLQIVNTVVLFSDPASFNLHVILSLNWLIHNVQVCYFFFSFHLRF